MSTSLFVPSFGAFGDFATAIGLAKSLIEILVASRGASMEYQDALAEISAVTSALQDALAVCAHLQGTDAQRIGALRAEVTRCESTMRAFEKTTSGYQRSLGAGGSGSRPKDLWRKIGWGLFKKPELVDFCDALQRHKSSLLVLLLGRTASQM